jgi:hypothetical protein
MGEVREMICEVCGLPTPRPEGEPLPTTPILPGGYDQCILDHRLTWWQRWWRYRGRNVEDPAVTEEWERAKHQ